MPNTPNEPRITMIEAFLLVVYILAIETMELILIFLALDDFFITDILAFPVTQLYLRFKGVRGSYAVIANIVELMPYLGFLPWRTIGIAFTIWADWHPESGIVQTVQGATQAVSVKTPKGGLAAKAPTKV